MLRGLHKATANWLGRAITAVVLGTIAVSFAIWGIGDIFRGFGRSTVATIGNVEIGVEQFRQSFNERLRLLSRQVGRPITPDQARTAGLDRQLLGELLAQAAVDNNAHALRLGLSDAEIAKRITTDPSLRGPTGQFDRFRFEQLLRQLGYSEARFVDEQRRVALRRQLADTLGGEMNATATLADVRNRFENEERRIDYVVLTPAQAGEIQSPAADVLAKYFDEHKFQYRAPEYRKLALIVVSPAEIAPRIEVSDADIKHSFEEHRDRYTTPERRELQQIVFPSMDEARAARERLDKGLAFAALATERGLKDQDINLGNVAKSAIIDRAVADAAFAAKEGEITQPIEGRFGATIVRVGKVEPEKSRPFEEIAPEIKRDIALERAKSQILDFHDKIEDARASGLTLTEVGKKLNLPVRSIEAIDRSGRAADGAPARDLPESPELIAGAFASDVGVENDPLQTAGGGFIWFDVIGVTPSHDRTLDEVKARVEENWRSEQIAARLKVKASELADKLKAQSMAEVAAANGLKAATADKLKRGNPTAAIPAKVLADVFRVAKGETGSAETDRPTERIVFRVADVSVPALDRDAPATKRIEEGLRRALGDDLVAQYISQLETDLGATINQDALRTAVGGSTN
jgi:peptidyl-prolyl cis-trans isomerase D